MTINRTRPNNCPRCGVELQVGESRRSILVEIQGVYDGGLYFKCPDCGVCWHRWPEGHPLYVRAVKHFERNGITVVKP